MANNKTQKTMYKKLFFVAAMLITTVSFAQFSRVDLAKGDAKLTWDYIGQPFVATTITGDSIDLAAWIDSGYSVVIDYSACWCPPCWSLHQGGVMEAFYNQFGPNGTNELRCLWIEIESTNTIDQIYGTSTGSSRSNYSQGDWTHGGTFPVPIIDDASTLSTCQSLYGGGIPYVVYIEGYTGRYCSLYGEPDGIASSNATAACSNMSRILENRARPGIAPRVSINSFAHVIPGKPISPAFSADVVSVETVTDESWSFEGGSPATAQGRTNGTTTWSTPGTYNVTYNAANENGSNQASVSVDVSDWEWGNTMSFLYGGAEPESAIGSGGSSEFIWGVHFEPQYLAGRKYMKSVDLYVLDRSAGRYTMVIYQGGSSAPETEIYRRTVNLSGDWCTINCSGAVPIDETKDLWVTFTSATPYPIAIADYGGDPNGCLINNNGTWTPLFQLTDYLNSFAVRVTTSDSPNAGIDDVEDANVALYPNPATDKVSIFADNIVRVEVLDVAGRIVATTTQNEVNISNLDNGVYMFRIITANGTSLQKVVKK